MDCVFCKRGSRRPGKVNHTFYRGDSIIVVKDIPAEVCDFCGEAYLSDAVTDVIERLIADAVRKGAEVEILRYAA
jgi:YgiT-type zinc finger domain-containing protein